MYLIFTLTIIILLLLFYFFDLEVNINIISCVIIILLLNSLFYKKTYENFYYNNHKHIEDILNYEDMKIEENMDIIDNTYNRPHDIHTIPIKLSIFNKHIFNLIYKKKFIPPIKIPPIIMV